MELLTDAAARALDQRGANWLTKQQTADAIGVSTRTVQELAAAGKLRTLRRPVEGGPPIAIYDPEDVQREKEKRDKLQVIPPATRNEVQSLVPMEQLVGVLAASLRPAPPKWNMTLTEASAASGLPKRYLRLAVDEGLLPAHRFGKRIWVHRADLEAFRGIPDAVRLKPEESAKLAKAMAFADAFDAIARCARCGGKLSHAAGAHVCEVPQ